MPSKADITPVKVIRKHCIECMGGCSRAVSSCTSSTCSLYPFRMGTNPYRKPSPRPHLKGKLSSPLMEITDHTSME